MHPARFIDATDAAAIMGRSRSWFYEKRRSLEQLGFPRPHPVIKRYDRRLIEQWVDWQSFLSDPCDTGSPFDGAF